MSETEKQCLTCDDTGHTYLECKVVPFVDLIAGAFNLPDIFSSQRRAEVRAALERIERRREQVKSMNAQND